MERHQKLRSRIDWIDCQIALLLNERSNTIDQITKLKANTLTPIQDRSRESALLQQIQNLVKHPLLKTRIARIYDEIIATSRLSQKFFLTSSIPFQRIGIIGLGLIGGSVCRAIRLKNPSVELATIKYPSEDFEAIKKIGYINFEYSNIKDIVEWCDLLVLATPINVIEALAEKIYHSINKLDRRLLVIDVASVKTSITKLFENLTTNSVEFVSTHPMAGKEKNGFENSDPLLFVDKIWTIVPHGKNDQQSIEQIKEFIRFFGSEPISLDAGLHDLRAALVSHIPWVISKSYLEFVTTVSAESLEISGPGFESFTRLGKASSDTDKMYFDIINSNRDLITKNIMKWIEFLENMITIK